MKVYSLFTCYIDDEYRARRRKGSFLEEDEEFSEYFEGVFSSFEKAAAYVKECLDEDDDLLSMEYQSAKMGPDSELIRTEIDYTRFYIVRQTILDRGEWVDLQLRIGSNDELMNRCIDLAEKDAAKKVSENPPSLESKTNDLAENPKAEN